LEWQRGGLREDPVGGREDTETHTTITDAKKPAHQGGRERTEEEGRGEPKERLLR